MGLRESTNPLKLCDSLGACMFFKEEGVEMLTLEGLRTKDQHVDNSQIMIITLNLSTLPLYPTTYWTLINMHLENILNLVCLK